MTQQQHEPSEELPAAEGAAEPGDHAATSVPEKVCCCCGCDVTSRRRAKDEGGEYLCYSCAAEEMEEQGLNVLASRCQDCQRLYHPLDLYRFGAEYLCESCSDERALGRGRKGGGGGGGDGGGGSSGKLWFGLFWLAVIVWLALHLFGAFDGAPAAAKRPPHGTPGMHDLHGADRS